jgi:hypothetical protein
MLDAGDQPPRAAWAKLIAELRNAGAEMTGGKPMSTQLAPGMVPVLRSLTALSDYLNGSAAAKGDPRITVPLLQLIAAIYKTQVAPAASGQAPDV